METGRFTSIPLEYRLCIFCDTNDIEDETHFLFSCNFYTDLRTELFAHAHSAVPAFGHLCQERQLFALMGSNLVKKTAEYIYKAYDKRRKFLYR